MILRRADLGGDLVSLGVPIFVVDMEAVENIDEVAG